MADIGVNHLFQMGIWGDKSPIIKWKLSVSVPVCLWMTISIVSPVLTGCFLSTVFRQQVIGELWQKYLDGGGLPIYIQQTKQPSCKTAI